MDSAPPCLPRPCCAPRILSVRSVPGQDTRSTSLSSISMCITILFVVFVSWGWWSKVAGPCASRKLLCHSSGGWKSDTQGLAGPSSIRERVRPCLVLLHRAPGSPQFGVVPLQPPPPPVHGCVPSLCVCLGAQFPLLIRTPVPLDWGPA